MTKNKIQIAFFKSKDPVEALIVSLTIEQKNPFYTR